MAILSSFQITKAKALLASKSLDKVAEYFGIQESELRAELGNNGHIIKRGRKRGTGTGRVISGGKKDRRVKWQEEKIKEGKCTSCGEHNDSNSLYHCKKCLKRRNDLKKKKETK